MGLQKFHRSFPTHLRRDHTYQIIFQGDFIDGADHPLLTEPEDEISLKGLVFRPLPVEAVSDGDVKKREERPFLGFEPDLWRTRDLAMGLIEEHDRFFDDLC